MLLNLKGFSLGVDFEKGIINSLIINGKERISGQSLIFRMRLRDRDGGAVFLTSADVSFCKGIRTGAVYKSLSENVTVYVRLEEQNGDAAWYIKAIPADDKYFVEWVEFPSVTLPFLEDNNTSGTGGKILFPYNEGALVSDMDNRENCYFRYHEAEYPSLGVYAVFPNMVCSQMLAYIWDECGLYIGAHDAKRGVKDINFYKAENGVTLRLRLYSGSGFGEAFETDYPVIFSVTEGRWEAAAERYRKWFEENLPKNAVKTAENKALPQWYEDSPLVVTYPVRGVHDMDKMDPNRLYPYTNALPIIEQIKEQCHSRLLVLLMHWEGTAPWAPPYVWQPYGGTENFNLFKEKLHENGDMLGVYCSGFGYTIQSNLVDSYCKKDEYEEKELWRGMCADVGGKVKISRICTGQRSGYDICPASEVGRELLNEAYRGLLESGIDYSQILDQNHGGGQYFCYSSDHGHPEAPGSWMTENMQELLSGWNEIAPNMLLGCESAASEPFIGNLRFSDNRYELNYSIGVPVPLYSYIYHEYLRNFMGNQVSCPLSETDDGNLLYRLAYSFSVGDSMTLVIDQDGQIKSRWGGLRTNHVADKEKILRLVENLTAFYKDEGKEFLFNGRMISSPKVECGKIEFLRDDSDRKVKLPSILSTAWESADGNRALILVNPSDEESTCRVEGVDYVISPLSAVKISF